MLDRRSHVPMYLQVKNEIVDMIRQDHFQVGDKVFSESEICSRYQVSAITAKRVLNELAQEGYVSRQPGRGSFVTQKQPLFHVLNTFYSFTNEIRERGMVPTNQLVRLEMVTPPQECAEFFKMKKGERALLVQRKRFADQDMIALDHSFMYGPVCEWITRAALSEASLYEILSRHDQGPDRAVESFGAEALSRESAELMDMREGAAVLKVDRRTYSRGEPMEYNFRYYSPGKYIYRIELRVGQSQSRIQPPKAADEIMPTQLAKV